MKKRGFTYIVTIITITLIVIGLTLLISNLKDELLIIKNHEDYIQADSYAESVLNIVLSDENLDRYIEDVYYTSKTSNITPFYNIKELDGCKIKLKPDNTIVKKGFLLSVHIIYKGVDGRFFAQGSAVNPMYLKKLDVLNPGVANEEETAELRQTFTKDPADKLSFVDYINLDSSDYFIKKDGRHFIIYRDVDGEEDIIAKGISTDSFHITQSGGSLCFVDDMTLRGIIDVDNIFLNADINLEGILVLRSPVNFLNNPKNIYVKGITINADAISENNVISHYDFEKIDLYSKSIANYIKPRIYSIKRSIDNK